LEELMMYNVGLSAEEIYDDWMKGQKQNYLKLKVKRDF